MTKSEAVKRFGAALAAVLLAVGAIAYRSETTPPGPPPTSTTTTTTTQPPSTDGTACAAGPAVTDDSTGTRSDQWPAARVASDPQCPTLVRTLFEHGSGRATLLDDVSFETGWKRLGTAEQRSNDYSIPTCTAVAGVSIRVYHRPNNPGSFDVPRGAVVPWSPACTIAGGKDGNIVVLAPQADGTVREWDFWNASAPGQETPDRPQVSCQFDANNLITRNVVAPNGLPPGVPPYNPARDLCAATAVLVSGPDGRAVDIVTYGGNSPSSNGGGVPLTRGQPGIDQVDAGRIGQTFKLMTANTASGPRCKPDSAVTIPLTTCATAVAPAGQFEGSGSRVGLERHAVEIMEGTRVALVMSDRQRDDLVASKGYPPVAARCLTVVVDALRVYGAEVLGSTPETLGASLKPDGGDPAGWRDRCLAGVNPDHFLDGVFRPEWMRVLAPPTNYCQTGPSKYACHAAGIRYP